VTLRLEGAPNFRDLGGYPTADGRHVRFGRVFRSELLNRVTDADLEAIRGASIGAVCDLRHGIERERQSNRWPEGLDVVTIGGPPADGLEVVQANGIQARIAQPDFDLDEAREALARGYRRMPLALAPALAVVFDHLLAPDAAPLLVHCTSGKDRSGFVSAVLLSALDVRREAIVEEYLLSRERTPTKHIRDMLVRFLGDRLPPGRLDALVEIATVSQQYLEAAFAEIDESWGGLGAYLEKGAGLDPGRRQALQRRLLG
jgi:protein-tyrosine phosphatase